MMAFTTNELNDVCNLRYSLFDDLRRTIARFGSQYLDDLVYPASYQYAPSGGEAKDGRQKMGDDKRWLRHLAGQWCEVLVTVYIHEREKSCGTAGRCMLIYFGPSIFISAICRI